MITDVAGRVRNVQLPASKPLLPLFEAINNSIEAIADAAENSGRIEIEVIREESSLFGKSKTNPDRQLAEITGFVVKDNGVGFDERNYDEFNKSDTTYKANRGGKGIGRFMWLAAFEKAEIESVYRSNGQAKRRCFSFSPKGEGIENPSCEDSTSTQRETIVRLIGYKEKYRKQCPKRTDTIAAYIVEEFLYLFLGPDCPKMILNDKAAGQSIDLDHFYDTEMVKHSDRKPLKIKKQNFDVIHIRLYSTHIPEHRLYFCASGRVVKQEKLTGIPNLAPRFHDSEGNEFVYAAYVNSPILDSTVNSDRTGFNIPEEGGEFLPDDITLNDLRKAIREHCKEYLIPYTEPIRKQKQERIQQFVQGDGIMYRPILKDLEKKFDRIEPNATNDEIDLQLYAAYHEIQVGLRKRGQELLQATFSEDVDFEKFEEQFEEYFEKISEVNRVNLARYVCHRKAIIEFLRRQLSRQADGKYKQEDRIHSIIFPRGKTSGDIFFEEHNLWLIDERLAFHVFLSSDKPINQAALLKNKSKKEPDILVFDKAIAFSETTDVPFSSVTIIEFKKPQRSEYSEKENPFTQIADYIRDIRGGNAKLFDGRALPVPPTLPFFCYIVCDITPRLEHWAQIFELQKTPDGIGFFGYKRNFQAYCEVISYSKLLADAEKRNKAFFEKLGIPKQISEVHSGNNGQSKLDDEGSHS